MLYFDFVLQEVMFMYNNQENLENSDIMVQLSDIRARLEALENYNKGTESAFANIIDQHKEIDEQIKKRQQQRMLESQT